MSEPGDRWAGAADSGDEARLLALYPALRRFAAVVAPPEVAPDDLVHDALVALLRRGALDAIDAPGAYLRQTMVNLAANHRRRLGRARRAVARLQSELSAATIDHYPSDLAHLAELQPQARAVLYLQLVEGLPTAAIAAELGLSDVAVRKIASRARHTLRDHIDRADHSRTDEEPRR